MSLNFLYTAATLTAFKAKLLGDFSPFIFTRDGTAPEMLVTLFGVSVTKERHFEM